MVLASLTVLVAGGCGNSEQSAERPSLMGDSGAGAGGGGAAGSAPVSSAGGPANGGSSAGGSPPLGGANTGGSAAAGGAGAGGAAPTVDREWALWTMPNPAGAGLPHPAAYDTTTEPLLVHDLVTSLTWPRALSHDYHDQREAVATCEALSLAGYDDWRLPTLIEYHSLLDWTQSAPAIDTTTFPDPNGANNLFWTASPNVSDPEDGAWVADFAFISSINTHPIIDRFPARCVRGGASPPAVHYMLEADTALDVSTGLTWERQASTPLYSSADAAAYCDALDLAQATDWRLPSVGELATLVNMHTSARPMMDPQAFPGEGDAMRFDFWASGPWILTFWGAEIHRRALTDTSRVRCVR